MSPQLARFARRLGVSARQQGALGKVQSAASLRFASTSPQPSRARGFLSTTLLLGGGALFLAYYYDSRSIMHEHVVMPLVRLAADPEDGHKLAIRILSLSKWARPRDMGVDNEALGTELFGLPLSNPVGIAAGFDKDAEAIDGLFDLGFGYVEIGSVTPEPQPGNPKPRFFRLEEDDAAINRYGFNSLGHGQALGQLRARLIAFSQEHPSLFPSPLPSNPLPPTNLPRSLRPGKILAVNLGKNKTSAADSNEDYVKGVRMLGPYADVLVVNVSSPNTPGLRALQGRDILARLLTDVVTERDRIAKGTGLPKIVVKVASDLGDEELADVAAAVQKSKVEGVIISNTTIRREELGLESENKNEVGGLSGRPLFPYALHALKTLRPLLPASIPIIGCGGIWTGSDAIAMARAGASIVQVYTVFGYRGVGTPRLLKDEISSALGGSSWRAEIGREWDGKHIAWNEETLQKESQAVVEEAKNLSNLLQSYHEEDDTQRLVEEAQAALRETSTQAADESTKTETESARGLVEDTLAPHVVEATATSSERLIASPSVEEGATDSLVEVAVVEVAPIVVVPVSEAPALPTGSKTAQEDGWGESVRSGPRRLV